MAKDSFTKEEMKRMKEMLNMMRESEDCELSVKYVDGKATIQIVGTGKMVICTLASLNAAVIAKLEPDKEDIESRADIFAVLTSLTVEMLKKGDFDEEH